MHVTHEYKKTTVKFFKRKKKKSVKYNVNVNEKMYHLFYTHINIQIHIPRSFY